MIIFLIVILIAVVVGGAIYSSILAKRRREAFASIAASLGLHFDPGKRYEFDEKFGFLNKLTQGSNRYAYNILKGQFQNYPVYVFDYHYETHSTDSKGRRRTHHHHFSFFMLNLENRFPELIITHENWLSKVAQFFGHDDIDFESAEFSKKFCVRSSNKKFAYDFCNARMIDFLLDHQDLDIELENHCLTLFFSRRLNAEQIIPNLHRLCQLRERMPNYLFDRRGVNK